MQYKVTLISLIGAVSLIGLPSVGTAQVDTIIRRLPPNSSEYTFSPAVSLISGLQITGENLFPTSGIMLPDSPGGTNAGTFGGRLKLDGFNSGSSFTSFFDVFVDINIEKVSDSTTFLAPGNVESFQVQMVSMGDASAAQPVQIRLDPGLQSSGTTTVTDTGKDFKIDSFFDVFTDISIDGGQTWVPTTPQRGTLNSTPEPSSAVAILACASVFALRRRRR